MGKAKMTLDRLASIMVESFEQVRGDIKDVQRDVTDLKRDASEIKTELKAHGKAIDKDALALIQHERRIKNLEQLR